MISGLILVASAVWIVRSRLLSSANEPPVGRKEQPAEGLARMISASGRIEPISEEIALGSEIPGRLMALLVEEGGSFRKGETLARLDDAEYRARLDSAMALRRQKEAELLRVRNGSREQERREALAMMRESEAVMENLKTERDRRATLFRTGDIAREEVERAERQLEVARARHAAAVERHSLIDAPARIEDVARAEAELALAQAAIDTARIMLDKTVIRAPLDGVVLRRHLRVGEIVAGGQAGGLSGASPPIFTLADLSRLRVRAEIDELDVGRLKNGLPAYATIDAWGDRRFNGRIVRIGGLFGRRTLRTDNPAERVDTKVLETMIDLDPIDDPSVRPQIGLRVNVFIEIPTR